MRPEAKHGKFNPSNVGEWNLKDIIMYLSKSIEPYDQWRTDKTVCQSLKLGPFESGESLFWKPRTPGLFSSAYQHYVQFSNQSKFNVTLTGFGYIPMTYNCAKINNPEFCLLLRFYSSKAVPFVSCRGNHRCSISNIFNLGFLFPWL